MKVKRQKHSIFFKGAIFALAFALTVLCFPLNGLVAFATDAIKEEKLNYITLGRAGEEVSTTVDKGSEYLIPNAYIGGSKSWKIGDKSTLAEGSNMIVADKMKLTKSEVEVTYYGNIVTSSEDAGGEDSRPQYNGKFLAENAGNYVVTYSYAYQNTQEEGSDEVEFSYQLVVTSIPTQASLNFIDSKVVTPSLVDLYLARVKDENGRDKKDEQSRQVYKNLYLDLPEVKDKSGNDVEQVGYVANNFEGKVYDKNGQEFEGSAKNLVRLTVTGGNGSGTVTLGKDETGFYIPGSYFADPAFAAGTYTIKYDYFVKNVDQVSTANAPIFVTSTKKTIDVRADQDDKNQRYYKDYKLELDLDTDWVDNGQTGVENTLPKAIGVTSSTTTPSNEKVDVVYSVKVLYRKNTEDKYTEINAIQGSKYYDDDWKTNNLNEDGSLKDKTKFKPLEDGYYSFIYTITDFYGNTVSNDPYVYEYRGSDNKGVADKTPPTVVVYDASNKDNKDGKFVDERYKSRSHASANGVVVYAIGMTDNYSEIDTEGVELYRRILMDDNEELFSIKNKEYAKFNLVFNYRDYESLLANNFNILKETRKLDGVVEKKIDSDVKMLNWLAENGYRVVVDNANYKKIYEVFKDEYFNTVEAVTDEATALAWFKTADALKAGFAYIDVDKTFGFNGDNGFGLGDFRIEYVAKDASGNTSQSQTLYMNIVTNEIDNDAPVVKFPTSLQATYLPTATIKFDVPTVEETRDSRVVAKTYYRYLDSEGKAIALTDEDGNTRTSQNLTEVWKDFPTYSDGEVLKDKYSAYHSDDNDGYIDLTDTNATSYSIDLKEVENSEKTAVKLQIFVYAYDDSGNVGVYATTVDITNTIDKLAPSLQKVSETSGTYYQGEEIKLPDYVFVDDAVEFMSYDVTVVYKKGDNTVVVPVVNDYHERDLLKLQYTVHAGKFIASYAGTYQVSVKVVDANNNTIVNFLNFDVKPRILVQPPQINSSLAKNQTIQVNGDSNYDPSVGIEIPEPTLSYEIPKSVTYDAYKEDIALGLEGADGKKSQYLDTSSEGYKNTDYVILGVTEENRVETWSTTYGGKNGFKPTKTGEYEIVYTVDLKVYNYKLFEYKEASYEVEREGEDPVYDEGGYLTYKGDPNAKVEFSDNNTFIVTVSGGRGTGDKKYNVVVEDRKLTWTIADTISDPSEEAQYTFFNSEKVVADFLELGNYKLTSEIYRVTVEDSIAPEMEERPYPVSLEPGTKSLTIYGISPTERTNDLDESECKIVVSWKLANGSSNSNAEVFSGKEAFVNHDFTDFPEVMDGKYKVSYTLVDVNGNRNTSYVYDIAVGDNNPPDIIPPEDFIKETYEIGKTTEIEVDLSDFTFYDAGLLARYTLQEDGKYKDAEGNVFEFKPTAKLVNTTTGEEIKPADGSEGLLYIFKLNEVGKYTLTVEVEDVVENTATKTFNFEVVAQTQNATMTYQIVGTVLIVISVLVLAGVIIYFIVSKVKLDKELKK